MRAGLEAIYRSGWQVAADANSSGQTYPDQSLYPADSVPRLVRRINQALVRADQIEHAEGKAGRDWFAPIVADAEAGFGGPLNAFEMMKAMIDAGAAGVHFEDQPPRRRSAAIRRQGAAADVAVRAHAGGGAPGGRRRRGPDRARGAHRRQQRAPPDLRRRPARPASLSGDRTPEGFFRIAGGLDCAIARGLAYAPYADLLWCETSLPDVAEARRFAHGIHAKFPGKLLAYNCSPSFNWKRELDDKTIAAFQRDLGAMGYKFQFVTLAGFHSLNFGMFDLARLYRERGMAAYAELQEGEFGAERHGFPRRASARSRDRILRPVAEVISGGDTLTLASTTRPKRTSSDAAPL